jgi:hypothetical protein
VGGNLYATPFVYSSSKLNSDLADALDASPHKTASSAKGNKGTLRGGGAGLDYYVHPAVGGGAIIPGTGGTLRKMYL